MFQCEHLSSLEFCKSPCPRLLRIINVLHVLEPKMTPVFPRNISGALGAENVLQNAKMLRYLGNPGTVKKEQKVRVVCQLMFLKLARVGFFCLFCNCCLVLVCFSLRKAQQHVPLSSSDFPNHKWKGIMYSFFLGPALQRNFKINERLLILSVTIIFVCNSVDFNIFSESFVGELKYWVDKKVRSVFPIRWLQQHLVVFFFFFTQLSLTSFETILLDCM